MNNSSVQKMEPSSSTQATTELQLQLPTFTMPTVNLENVEDLSKVCRVCATITEQVIPIFSGEGLRNNLADKIYKHLPIKVSERDSPELPVVMCYACASTLLATHELVKCSIQADTALRRRAEALRARRPPELRDIKPKDENPPSTPDTAVKRCPYCPARPLASEHRAHLLAAHLALVFHCQHCDALVSRRLLISHMTTHAIHNAAPPPQPPPPLPPQTATEAPISEFSDHSDAEFAPLPESVFTAIEDKEPPPKRERVCLLCGKKYRAASSYFYHLKHSHTRNKEHECAQCGARFGTRGALKEHGALHSNARPLQCTRCPKRFRTRASLYIHQQTHTGAKSYVCTQCPRAFRWRAQLRRHAARHDGARPHACSLCPRAFSVRADLLRHARTHAAAALACPEPRCGATFAQPRYLRAHRARKHPQTTAPNT